MNNLNAILALAYRDLLKLLRDRPRLISSLIFPFIIIGAMGGTLQMNFGQGAGYDFLTFAFTGVLAQTMFQSTTMGIISLMDDRENDFSQEIFVSPISRYAIVFGKILGEALVALVQGVGIVVFALVIGLPVSFPQLATLLPISLAVSLFGGSFGLVVVSNLQNRRTADQFFPYVMLPQYFLAGVFTPVKVLPFYLDVLSRISPMRYAVDLTRAVFYAGQEQYSRVVLDGPVVNLIVMGAMFGLFLIIGTMLFVRNERNR